jgi:hypothetical protein
MASPSTISFDRAAQSHTAKVATGSPVNRPTLRPLFKQLYRFLIGFDLSYNGFYGAVVMETLH